MVRNCLRDDSAPRLTKARHRHDIRPSIKLCKLVTVYPAFELNAVAKSKVLGKQFLPCSAFAVSTNFEMEIQASGTCFCACLKKQLNAFTGNQTPDKKNSKYTSLNRIGRWFF